jgi:putative transposase
MLLTQRGNGRRFILDCDADRKVYLSLLRENIDFYDVSLIGYCLMSNHVHLIAVPRKADGLAQALKQTHGRYASYWNAAHQSSGHMCGKDDIILARWTSLISGRHCTIPGFNPLRARLVSEAELWPWSSAASHRGARADDDSLDLKMWRGGWTAPAWREYLGEGEMESKLAVIRRRTHNRPAVWELPEFIHGLERRRSGGSSYKARAHEKIVTDRRQGDLRFDP